MEMPLAYKPTTPLRIRPAKPAPAETGLTPDISAMEIIPAVGGYRTVGAIGSPTVTEPEVLEISGGPQVYWGN